MKRMKEVLAHDRPREKIRIRGASSLSDQELIAAILGSGGPGRDVRDLSKELAQFLEDRPGSLSYDDLIGIRGMGPAKISQILACVEFARRYFKNDKQVTKISSPSDVLPLVSFLEGKRQEYFVCITLSGAHEVISVRTVTVGILNHSLVHPRELDRSLQQKINSLRRIPWEENRLAPFVGLNQGRKGPPRHLPEDVGERFILNNDHNLLPKPSWNSARHPCRQRYLGDIALATALRIGLWG